MYKRFLPFLLALFAFAIPFSAATAKEKESKDIQAAIVFNRSVVQVDDKSFIAAVKSGAQRAMEELKIPLKLYMQDKDQDDVAFLSSVADDGADIIIGMSFVDTSPLLDMAEKYPNVKFVVVDGVVPPLYTNAKSIIFREHEGSFLVGMIAALKSKTGKIGFIGGRDLPLIRNFASGYTQGAKYVSPKIEVNVEMIGEEFAAWDKPATAKKMANAQFDGGVDVIFAAAGASGMGVLEAASKRKDTYAIGVDSNQNDLYPGHVLTSMIKKVDVAIFEALKNIKNGDWDAGILNLGLKEGAIDYAVDEHNRELLDEAMLGLVENARQQIIDGSLTVQMYSPQQDAKAVEAQR
jgi:basic membrane protein A and related proteins